ncbi:hypothetical protein NSQ43_15180 [Sporosarcina sp. FSL W8-0480]|uniref:hypothetical protein n=1 Tax=Sporosarcina sp. FSL W8-0480 TaxID=2954701 RepID=UPI0030DBC250
MSSKMPILLILLIIGSVCLVLSLTLSLSEGLKMTLLIIAVIFNITSSVGLMIIGAKKTRESL